MRCWYMYLSPFSLPLSPFSLPSHARLWTLIACAERHGVDPQRYLTSVLAKVGQTKLSELEQFLPDAWKEAAATPDIA
jgi:hypothetical protein